ncbi:MAG: TonB-dependent receptor [Prevotellaceae bacterium]|jgi:hypothetical protein|nr:TonB-dependent receptor [Prevotellaceae bacterium]
MRKSSLFLFAALFFGVGMNAQTLRGHVYTEENGKKVPLYGAIVYFSGTAGGVETDRTGSFVIEKRNANEKYLTASMVGFTSDSLPADGTADKLEFTLFEGVELEGVTVSKNRDGVLISRLTSAKTELITSTGLKKLACCNLSESFENSASVTVGFTDAVSGARQVQLLGLQGVYSQLQIENIPALKGLLSNFGWSYLPGSWMESIQISKGASSVVNGYESVSGQINLEMKKPNYTEPLFVNLYADHLGRYEANLTSAVQAGKDLWTGLLVHGSTDAGTHDYNGDTFLDMPKSKFVNVFNRWFYLPEDGVQSRTGIRFLYDERQGGQDFSHGDHSDHGEPYETNIRNRGFTLENKTGFFVGSREGQSIGIISSFNHVNEDLIFGRKSFGGIQNSFYGNVLFRSDFGKSHQYTVGGSFAYDNYITRFEDRLMFNMTPQTAIDRHETVPGLFGEYTYSYLEKFTFLLGLREDYNSHYGWLFTPRANVRYGIIEEIVVRASAGRGYRSPNVISDNIGLLATSRKFELEGVDGLEIEEAWNYGGNVSFYIPVWNEQTLTLSMDYFHTQFRNQAVIDVERNRNSVFFYNMQGDSYADAWQVDVALSPFRGFDVFTAFRYNDTKVTYTENGVHHKMEKPLTSRYRGLVNLAYATSLRKWVFDFTAQLNGPSRIPGLNGYDSELKHSTPFPIYFAQITKNTKHFDVYLGVENILDFKQDNPILNPDLPFSRDFDSSLVWGPIIGRKVYAGIRLRVKN